MPIRLRDQSVYLGRAAASLDNFAPNFDGSFVGVGTFTGTLARQLQPFTGAMVGQYQSVSLKTGTIGVTLQNASAAIVGATADTVAPPAPSAPTIDAFTSTSITIRFPTSSAPDHASWNVWRSPEGNFWTQIATGVTAATYTNSGLTASTAYYYALVDVDDSANASALGASVSQETAAVGSDNPDGWAESGNLWMDVTYETEVAEEKSSSSMVTNVWASNYGRGGGGGWRAIPNVVTDQEAHSGWAGAAYDGGYSSAGNGADRFFLSFTMLLSQAMIDNVLVEANGRMKFLDANNADGGGTGNNRWVTNLVGSASGRLPSGDLKFGFASGGAGTDLYDDGVNTNWDLALYPDEFIWFCLMLDAPNTESRLYAKRQGDPGVSRLLVRDESVAFGSEIYADGGFGWLMPLPSVGGYWDWERNGYFSFSTDQYMTIDDMKLSDYWTGPPF